MTTVSLNFAQNPEAAELFRATQAAVKRPAPTSVVAIAPIGLRREAAARSLGMSPNKFDQLVATGELPPARLVGGMKIWSVRELDDALQTSPQADSASALRKREASCVDYDEYASPQV